MTRRLRGDDGATAVEVALVLPLLLMLLGGILVFGLRMTYGALATHTAEVGLRDATLRTSAGYPSESDVRDGVEAMAITDLLGDPDSVTLAVTSTTTRKRQGDRVTVTVAYDVPAVRAAAGIVPFLSSTLESLATIEQTVDGRLE